MKCGGDGRYVLEEGEPVTQTCRLCYPEQGAQAKCDKHTLFQCPLCGRFYVCGRYVDEFSREDFEAFVSKRLEHTEVRVDTKIDASRLNGMELARLALRMAERVNLRGVQNTADMAIAIAVQMTQWYEFTLSGGPSVPAFCAKFWRMDIGDVEGYGDSPEEAILRAFIGVVQRLDSQGKEG